MARSATQGRGIGLVGAPRTRLDSYLVSPAEGKLRDAAAGRSPEAAAAEWSEWCVTKCFCFCCCCTEAELGDTAGGAEEITAFVLAFKRMLTGVNRPAAAASRDAERPRLNPFWTTNTLTDEGTAQPIRVSDGDLSVPNGYKLRGGDRSGVDSDGRLPGRDGSRRSGGNASDGRAAAAAAGAGGGDGDALSPEAGWDSFEHDGFPADDATSPGDSSAMDLTRVRQSSVDSDPATSPDQGQSHEVEPSQAAVQRVQGRTTPSSPPGSATGTAAPVSGTASVDAPAAALPSSAESAAGSVDSTILGPASEASEQGLGSGGRGRSVAHSGRVRNRPSLLVSDVPGDAALPDVTDGASRFEHDEAPGIAGEVDAGAMGYELGWQRRMRAAGIPYGNPRPCGEFYEG
jgi:hypothetical protein